MATSGTTDFDLSVEEVIQEAYERCGLTTSSGYDLKTPIVMAGGIFNFRQAADILKKEQADIIKSFDISRSII